MQYFISSREIEKLLRADWQTPHGAIYVRDDLSVDEANRSTLFRNARTLVNALNESGGTKATASGNLNRKFVAEMMEKIELPPKTALMIRRVNKVINEEDVWPLHITRVIVELAGLVRRHGGMFKAVQKKQHLLADLQAGQLYNLLFLTFFRRFHLTYLDHMDEAPLVQDTLPISLFLVSRLMNDWVTVDEVVDFLFPAQVRQQLPVPAYGDIAVRLAYSRIVRPLLWLGLLEDRKWDEGSLAKTELRKTELFDRVLQFNVKIGSTTGYLH